MRCVRDEAEVRSGEDEERVDPDAAVWVSGLVEMTVSGCVALTLGALLLLEPGAVEGWPLLNPHHIINATTTLLHRTARGKH